MVLVVALMAAASSWARPNSSWCTVGDNHDFADPNLWTINGTTGQLPPCGTTISGYWNGYFDYHTTLSAADSKITMGSDLLLNLVYFGKNGTYAFDLGGHTLSIYDMLYMSGGNNLKIVFTNGTLNCGTAASGATSFLIGENGTGQTFEIGAGGHLNSNEPAFGRIKSGATLRVCDGGWATFSSWRPAYSSNAQWQPVGGNLVEVKGDGSKLQIYGDLSLGSANYGVDTNDRVLVRDSALLALGVTNGIVNTATISSYIGRNTGCHSLVVSNQASFVSFNRNLLIGNAAAASNNLMAVVAGSSAVLSNGSITVGSSTAANNRLLIDDSTFVATNVTFGATGTNGTIEIVNGADVKFSYSAGNWNPVNTAGGTLIVSNATLALDGRSLGLAIGGGALEAKAVLKDAVVTTSNSRGFGQRNGVSVGWNEKNDSLTIENSKINAYNSGNFMVNDAVESPVPDTAVTDIYIKGTNTQITANSLIMKGTTRLHFEVPPEGYASTPITVANYQFDNVLASDAEITVSYDPNKLKKSMRVPLISIANKTIPERYWQMVKETDMIKVDRSDSRVLAVRLRSGKGLLVVFR